MPTMTTRVTRNARERGLTVLSRSQWGSRPSGYEWPLAPNVPNVYAWRRRNKPHAPFPADTLVQHITVTEDHGELVGDFRKDMQTVERIGFDRFGSGFSYNWGVDMATGMVGAGMPLDAKGTHTVNDTGYQPNLFSIDQNAVAFAIAVVGMPDDELSARAEAAIVQLIAAHIDEGALRVGFDYLPHSVFAAKDCPCDATRDRMDEIRAKVRRVVQ